MPTRFRVDANLSSGFEEEIYYNRRVEVLFDPKNVLSREPIEVSNIIKMAILFMVLQWLGRQIVLVE